MCTALKLQSFVLYRKMLDKNNSSVKILQVNILLPLLDIAFFFSEQKNPRYAIFMR